MNEMVRSAPPAGTAAPGDLYVDLQSRQMWLGVDPSVDPAEAVLICDIVALQAADTTMLNTAKSYTDTQIATRAPTSHTHTASQVTDFNAAVLAAISSQPGTKAWYPRMICMYSGPVSDIGVGNFANWALCDGTSYTVKGTVYTTPDLRDRFVIGAGNAPNNTSNAGKDLVTNTTGSHRHTNTAIGLTEAQIPSHQHYCSLGGSGSGGTDAQGNHSHTYPVYGGDGGRGEGAGSNGLPSLLGNFSTAVAGNHAHNVSVNVNVAGWSNATGSGAGHTHPMDLQGDHAHNVTLADLKASIPYYYIAFIMKLPDP